MIFTFERGWRWRSVSALTRRTLPDVYFFAGSSIATTYRAMHRRQVRGFQGLRTGRERINCASFCTMSTRLRCKEHPTGRTAFEPANATAGSRPDALSASI